MLEWSTAARVWQCSLGLRTNAELIHFAIKHGLVEI
jgi:hypothetical protein